MKRKFICVISAMLLAVSIAGCGSKIKTSSETKEEVVTEEENTIAEIEDEAVAGEKDAEDDNSYFEEMYTTIEVEGGIAITQYNAFGENEIVEIPNEINGKSVISIGTIDEMCKGFSNDGEIKKIIISDSVNYIGAEAFAYCWSLETVEFGTGVEELGDQVFYGCTLLTEVKFSEGLKKLGMAACGGCYSLNKVSVPKSLTEIADGNFVACADDMVITAPSGSVAEEYAKSNEFTFQAE